MGAMDLDYVVQTNEKVIERCLLMTTDPGDLVLDPTCGSGTTAYVAEQWGRRWITLDVSRVALAIARQRLLTSKFDYYRLRPTSTADVQRNPGGPWLTDPTGQIPGTCSFDCKTVPHITLKSIAQNQALDPIFAKWEPILAGKLASLNAALAQTVTKDLRRKLLAKLELKQKREGKRALTDADLRQVAVVFGPQYGPLTTRIVEEGIRIAARRGFDDLVFAAFSFDAQAQVTIQEVEDPALKLHMAQIRPDVNMGDLLKTTVSSQLFTVSGSPRTRVARDGDGQYVVHMEGVDIYDPVTNAVRSTGAEKVAAWFLDSDYDGRCFCICQAFFPGKSAWAKLGKALNGALDEDAFAKLSGTVSLPFPAGEHQRIAVKVIDPRGNEVLRVHKLGEYEKKEGNHE